MNEYLEAKRYIDKLFRGGGNMQKQRVKNTVDKALDFTDKHRWHPVERDGLPTEDGFYLLMFGDSEYYYTYLMRDSVFGELAYDRHSEYDGIGEVYFVEADWSEDGEKPTHWKLIDNYDWAWELDEIMEEDDA